jgi:hypothetical protein
MPINRRIVGLPEVYTMEDDRYWPFEVIPPERRTLLHQQQISFLETAYGDGFRPYTFGSNSYGATAGDREGYVIHRTRRFWELLVASPSDGKLSAYVGGFDVNAEALLRWLRGSELADILEFIRPHLVPAGTRSSGYKLDPPDPIKVN